MGRGGRVWRSCFGRSGRKHLLARDHIQLSRLFISSPPGAPGPVWKALIQDTHRKALGLASLTAGLILAIGSFILSQQGWEISRLWLYLLASAMFVLIGVQLLIYWVLVDVLDELSQRYIETDKPLPLGE